MKAKAMFFAQRYSINGYPNWQDNNLDGNLFLSALQADVQSFSNTTNLFGSFSVSNKWLGGVLAPNGKIYGIPTRSTQILEIGNSTITQNTNKVLSRYLNKF